MTTVLNLSRYPPPTRFKGVPAGVLSAVATELKNPPFVSKRTSKGKRAAGQRYERRVHKYMTARYPLLYCAAPWFKYKTLSSPVWQWCQPDGLVFDIRGGRIIIFEIKLKHTTDAWWQVRKLYEPIVRTHFGKLWRYSAVEICRWYDPSTGFPEPQAMLKSPLEIDNGRFGVYIHRT